MFFSAGHMLLCSGHGAERNNAQTVEIAKWEDDELFENMRRCVA
jgi:hypothetical protein